MRWPTTLLMGNVDVISDGRLIGQVGAALLDLQLVADFREFIEVWLGKDADFLLTPVQQMELDEPMLEHLAFSLSLQKIICDSDLDDAVSVGDCSTASTRAHEVHLLVQLVERIGRQKNYQSFCSSNGIS